MTSGLKIERVC